MATQSNMQRDFKRKSQLRRGDVPNDPKWQRARMAENQNMRTGRPSAGTPTSTAGPTPEVNNSSTLRRGDVPNDPRWQQARMRENANLRRPPRASTPPTSPNGSTTPPRSAAPSSAPSAGRSAGGALRGVGRALPGVGTALLAAEGAQYADARRQAASQQQVDRAFEDPSSTDVTPIDEGYPGGTPVDTNGEVPEWVQNANFEDAPVEDAPVEDMGGEEAPAPRDPALSTQRDLLRNMGVPDDVAGTAPVGESTRRALVSGQQSLNPGQTVNLGTYGSSDPGANIYGTADETGRVNSFTGVGLRRRTPEQRMAEGMEANRRVQRATEIYQSMERPGTYSEEDRANQRASAAARRIRAEMPGGTPRRDMLRQQALDAVEARRQEEISGLRTNRNNLEVQRLANEGAVEAQNARSSASLQAKQLELLQQAREDALDRADSAREGQIEAEETGYERYVDAISTMFTDPETQEVDTAEQERFRTFVETTAPQLPDELNVNSRQFAELQPAEQMQVLRDLRRLYEMNEVRNENVGPQMQSVDRPVSLRESAWSDVVNRDLGVMDYLQSNLPFTDPRVVETESGVVVPYDELTGDDAERQRVLNRLLLRNQNR